VGVLFSVSLGLKRKELPPVKKDRAMPEIHLTLGGIPVVIRFDPNGVQLCIHGRESPCAILDAFEGQIQLLAFNERKDEPELVVKWVDRQQSWVVQP
jgi:hypothetical protein